MSDTDLEVLDERGQSYDPPVTVRGRLTVARQPMPWEAPTEIDPQSIPTHTLAVSADAEGLRPRRMVQDVIGQRWLIMGPLEMSAGLDPGTRRWRLRRQERF